MVTFQDTKDFAMLGILILVLLCGQAESSVLSRSKKITSSSVLNSLYDRQYAIDGNPRRDAMLCQCCAATVEQLNPWYQLDLGKTYTVRQIIIEGRIQITFGHCANGEFGEYCERECHCDGAPCNSSGICPGELCLPGYEGPACDTFCGDKCPVTCGHCSDSNTCDRETGRCPNKCARGYKGDTCKQECDMGTYGIDCAETCGQCKDEIACVNTNGSCPTGCVAGYQSDTCKAECVMGMYGVDCAETCGNCKDETACVNTNGSCPTGCMAGYQGDTCKAAKQDEEESRNLPTLAIVGGSLGGIAVLVVVVVVIVIFYRIRSGARQKTRAETNLYDIPNEGFAERQRQYESPTTNTQEVP